MSFSRTNRFSGGVSGAPWSLQFGIAVVAAVVLCTGIGCEGLSADLDGVEPPSELDAGGDALDADPDLEDTDTTGGDADVTDADTECTPESDREFCQRHGAECGEVVELDNCEEPRSVDCDQFDDFGCGPLGTCLLAEENEAVTSNLCTCPDVDFSADDAEICDEVGYDCGSFDPAERCAAWAGDELEVVDCSGCEGAASCGVAAPNVCGCPCEIDDGCYAEGESLADSPCQVCNPEESETEFSDAEDGTRCGDDSVCQSGACVCAGEFEPCGGDCVDIQVSDDHCGGCDIACSELETCDGGQCVCADGYTECGDGCVDTDTDPEYCGGCDTACGELEACSSGDCVENCPQGETVCSGSCRDTQTDDQHCGTCDNDCTANDGWYDSGTSYECCDGGNACTCQDREYREYYCSSGNCDYDVTDQQTGTSGCATCNDSNACTDSYCSGGTCQNDAYCSGTDTECGCTSCENCNDQDGWYDDGSSYACCDNGEDCTCQDQIYRDYYCDGTGCEYDQTDSRTVTSGCSGCGNNALCSSGGCVCETNTVRECDIDGNWYVVSFVTDTSGESTVYVGRRGPVGIDIVNGERIGWYKQLEESDSTGYYSGRFCPAQVQDVSVSLGSDGSISWGNSFAGQLATGGTLGGLWSDGQTDAPEVAMMVREGSGMDDSMLEGEWSFEGIQYGSGLAGFSGTLVFDSNGCVQNDGSVIRYDSGNVLDSSNDIAGTIGCGSVAANGRVTFDDVNNGETNWKGQMAPDQSAVSLSWDPQSADTEFRPGLFILNGKTGSYPESRLDGNYAMANIWGAGAAIGDLSLDGAGGVPSAEFFYPLSGDTANYDNSSYITADSTGRYYLDLNDDPNYSVGQAAEYPNASGGRGSFVSTVYSNDGNPPNANAFPAFPSVNLTFRKNNLCGLDSCSWAGASPGPGCN